MHDVGIECHAKTNAITFQLNIANNRTECSLSMQFPHAHNIIYNETLQRILLMSAMTIESFIACHFLAYIFPSPKNLCRFTALHIGN